MESRKGIKYLSINFVYCKENEYKIRMVKTERISNENNKSNNDILYDNHNDIINKCVNFCLTKK